MAIRSDGPLGRWLHRRSLMRWATAARSAASADLATLRAQRQQARQLKTRLQELSYVAESRLALPRIGSTNFTRPGGTDWSWRPQAWRAGLDKPGLAPARNKMKLGREVTIFHDCRTTEISLRQTRNQRDHDLSPFGLMLEVFRFDGKFLSLAIDLPEAACNGLKKRHLIRLGTQIECEQPTKIFARLNVKHGPNTEKLLLTLPSHSDEVAIEYDLAYSKLNEKRVDAMWLDLMVENPQMNQINIRDLNFCRYPRAEL